VLAGFFISDPNRFISQVFTHQARRSCIVSLAHPAPAAPPLPHPSAAFHRCLLKPQRPLQRPASAPATRKGKTEARPKKRFSGPVLCSGRYFLCLFVFGLCFVRRRWATGGELSACSRRGGGGSGGWGGVRSLPPIGYPPSPPWKKKIGKSDDSWEALASENLAKYVFAS
jgi:hypothetical protein